MDLIFAFLLGFSIGLHAWNQERKVSAMHKRNSDYWHGEYKELIELVKIELELDKDKKE